MIPLIEKCINRDRDSWDIFINKYSSLVLKAIKYKLSKLRIYLSKNDLNDIVQNIFFYIWDKNKLSTLKDKKALEPWLCMIAINKSMDYYRKNIIKSNTMPLSDLAIDLPSEKYSKIIEGIDNKDTLNGINTIIKTLPVKQKLALKFFIFDNLPQKDISKIMNIPVNTVSVLIKRARDTIKNKVNKEIFT